MSEEQTSIFRQDDDPRATDADKKANLDKANALGIVSQENTIDLTKLQIGANPEVKGIPHYICHKEVQAFKIGKIVADADLALKEGRETDGNYWLFPDDKNIPAVKVTHNFMLRHIPTCGGYFVLYPLDGYMSFSPAQPFEKGYALIKENGNST